MLRRPTAALLHLYPPRPMLPLPLLPRKHYPLQYRTLRTLPSFSLEGKTCVVTGAARGLGKEFLTAFALSGARAACVDLTLEAGNSSIAHVASHVAATQPTEPAPLLKAYACNATIESDVQATWAQIVADFGKVDVLVTAAGIVDNVAAEDYSFPRWRKMLDINLDGTWIFAREAGKHMLAHQIHGSIILIASMSATICVRPQKQAAYNASKGAVAMLAKSLATEWGPSGIRVNSLSPGYMRTDLIKGLLQREGKGLVDNWVKDIPMQRMAEPSELQGTIVWMASEASSYLNGSDVVSSREMVIDVGCLLIGHRSLMVDIQLGSGDIYKGRDESMYPAVCPSAEIHI